jgi:hypothetical protein
MQIQDMKGREMDHLSQRVQKRSSSCLVLIGLAFMLCCPGRAFAATDAVQPGELIIERPTLISLGFEWRLQGDSNGNATCTVHYREKGTDTWTQCNTSPAI